ncbi:hypothetical protein WJX77_002356 [Trebouxia sp. C0004]
MSFNHRKKLHAKKTPNTRRQTGTNRAIALAAESLCSCSSLGGINKASSTFCLVLRVPCLPLPFYNKVFVATDGIKANLHLSFADSRGNCLCPLALKAVTDLLFGALQRC